MVALKKRMLQGPAVQITRVSPAKGLGYEEQHTRHTICKIGSDEIFQDSYNFVKPEQVLLKLSAPFDSSYFDVEVSSCASIVLAFNFFSPLLSRYNGRCLMSFCKSWCLFLP